MASTIGWSEVDIARYSDCERLGNTIFFLDTEIMSMYDRVSGIDISQGDYDNRRNNCYPGGMIADTLYLILAKSMHEPIYS